MCLCVHIYTYMCMHIYVRVCEHVRSFWMLATVKKNDLKFGNKAKGWLQFFSDIQEQRRTINNIGITWEEIISICSRPAESEALGQESITIVWWKALQVSASSLELLFPARSAVWLQGDVGLLGLCLRFFYQSGSWNFIPLWSWVFTCRKPHSN